MAATGLEGNEDIFGAPHGLIDAWGIENGKDALTKGLGTDFSIMGANFKFFNAGYPIHTPVEAAMGLIEEHGIGCDAIESIQIGMPENATRVVDNRHMHNICVQDMVATSLARGGLKLRDLPFPSVLADPMFRRIRSLITVGVDLDLQRECPDGRGARVTIVTTAGARHSRRVDHPRGHSLRGDVTWSELSEKWRGALIDCDVEAALALAQGLEDLEDVNTLSTAFSGLMR